MSVLNKKVLQLNAFWQPIGTTTVKKALEDMNSLFNPKKALKIEYVDSDGFLDFSKPIEITPLSWGEWIQLYPRFFDEEVIRSPKLLVRVPTVVIAPVYKKMPVKTFKPTKRNIYNRYNGQDAYTGEFLSYKIASLDHIWPKSKKGPNSWENLVLCHPKINRIKGNRTPEEAGLKLLYQPSEPKPVPALITIKDENPDWTFFVKHGNGDYKDI